MSLICHIGMTNMKAFHQANVISQEWICILKWHKVLKTT